MGSGYGDPDAGGGIGDLQDDAGGMFMVHLNLRCKMGWHHWRYVRTVFDYRDNYTTREERRQHVRAGVLLAHEVFCRRCGRKSTVLHTRRSSAITEVDDGTLRYMNPRGTAWEQRCAAYVVGRHHIEQADLCDHPRHSHGIWDTYGDHFIEGHCRDCHCEGFV